MTSEVTIEGYLSFEDGLETHNVTVNRAQDDWSGKGSVRCIKDVTSELRQADNEEADNEEIDEEIKQCFWVSQNLQKFCIFCKRQKL